MRPSGILRAMLLALLSADVARVHASVRSSSGDLGDSSSAGASGGSVAAAEATLLGFRRGSQQERRREKRIVKKNILWRIDRDEVFHDVKTYVKDREWEEVEVAEPGEKDDGALIEVVYREFLLVGDEAVPLAAYAGEDGMVRDVLAVAEELTHDASGNDDGGDEPSRGRKGELLEFFFFDEADHSWDLRKTVGIRRLITRVPKMRAGNPPRLIRAAGTPPTRRHS